MSQILISETDIKNVQSFKYEKPLQLLLCFKKKNEISL